MNNTKFLIFGETASGKDSLVDAVCEKLNLKKLRSYTTRPRREGEDDSKHTFVDSYNGNDSDDPTIAITHINGNTYWATYNQFMDSDFYIIDWEGAKRLKGELEDVYDEMHIVKVLIHAPDCVRTERALNNRHDNDITYYKRCLDETKQFAEMRMLGEFDYAVCNVDFDKALKILETIVREELNG